MDEPSNLDAPSRPRERSSWDGDMDALTTQLAEFFEAGVFERTPMWEDPADLERIHELTPRLLALQDLIPKCNGRWGSYRRCFYKAMVDGRITWAPSEKKTMGTTSSDLATMRRAAM